MIGRWLRPVWAFLATLFGRRDPIVARSLHGHSVLQGWDRAPEEAVLDGHQRRLAAKPAPARVGLYGVAGAHRGELFTLGKRVERVGVAATDDIVLTPAAESDALPCLFQMEGAVMVSAPTGKTIKVNGRSKDKATLYDFDEIEIAGNSFLVLELGR